LKSPEKEPDPDSELEKSILMVMQQGKSLNSFADPEHLSPKFHYKIKHEAAKLV
jgi:hypothetical protein